MSKSLGNVISPHDVIVKKSLGVDVMRWWVAKHASSSASVSVSNNILQACKADLDRMRNCLRFLLGQISSLEKDFQPLDYQDLILLDKLGRKQSKLILQSDFFYFQVVLSNLRRAGELVTSSFCTNQSS